MKFNAKYNRYVSKEGLVYKVKDGILKQCKTFDVNGYELCSVKGGKRLVHRIVYETFVGDIPEGYEIHHINSIRDDNRLINLQLMTCDEHMSVHGHTIGFGHLFKEHYHMTSTVDHKLYLRELMYYKRHNNMCRWQM